VDEEEAAAKWIADQIHPHVDSAYLHLVVDVSKPHRLPGWTSCNSSYTGSESVHVPKPHDELFEDYSEYEEAFEEACGLESRITTRVKEILDERDAAQKKIDDDKKRAENEKAVAEEIQRRRQQFDKLKKEFGE
jgi:hypothetical protein